MRRCIEILFFFFLAYGSYGQDSKSALEAKKKYFLTEIARFKKLKNSASKKEQSLLVQVQALNAQVRVTKNLIRLTNRQANVLQQKIKSNTNQINTLKEELSSLKSDYAEMIKKSHKSKSQYNRLLFLLSSENFLQAYKRIQYMKQYTKFRKKQGLSIQEKSKQLKVLNADLKKQEAEKNALIAENQKTKANLEKEQAKQRLLIKKIQSNKSQYAKQIRTQQRKTKDIERRIEKLIRDAIARSNKKVGKSKNYKNFHLTPESKKLAIGFQSNRGKLPWPVVKGRVVKKFGKQPHPILRGITIQNSGVDIETEKNQIARAIFEGEVSTIQTIKGAGKLVQIRHGNYITTYYNLENIQVKEGDKVTTKQKIGNVHTSSATGQTIMKFLIFENSKFVNPQKWIYRM